MRGHCRGMLNGAYSECFARKLPKTPGRRAKESDGNIPSQVGGNRY